MTTTPITVADLWDLHADPAAVEAAAAAWRRAGAGGADSADLLHGSSNRVLADGVWTGDAADSYRAHRDRVGSSLDEFTDLTGHAAEGMAGAAYALRTGQSQLDGQFAALTSAVPASRTGKDVTFQPADETQAATVRAAVAEAEEVRSWVDERLTGWAEKLRSVADDLDALTERWPAEAAQPRTLRLMDLNVGRGKGNTPWDASGTEYGELADVADSIVDNDANVVTVQEVFHDDVHGDGLSPGLVDALEARTGDDWEAHFTPASHKLDTQGWRSWVDGPEEFGNAILVNNGDAAITDTSEIADESLQSSGMLGWADQGEEGRSINGARIQLAD